MEDARLQSCDVALNAAPEAAPLRQRSRIVFISCQRCKTHRPRRFAAACEPTPKMCACASLRVPGFEHVCLSMLDAEDVTLRNMWRSLV